MEAMGPLFRDRIDAARQLSAPLMKFADKQPFVLGMARGGVVVAGEIAQALGAAVDVLVVRKVGAPMNPEYGVGAVAPGGVSVFDHAGLAALGLTPADMQPSVTEEVAEIDRRLALFRRGMLPLELSNRLVILVDDGLATGITALAAARYVKSLGASYVVFAAPVCSRPGIRSIEEEVEEVVCLHAPQMFFAVGLWYEDFSQVEDYEVMRVMEVARRKEFLA
jgi:predicted phosphoribosyltransferase